MKVTEGSDSNARDEAGAVLLITLALIALITVAVVAYFSRTVTNRRIESASAGATRADILARGAIQIIVSDTKAEIVGGSNITQPVGQMPVYTPNSAQSAVPARVLIDPAMLTDSSFNSLVKQSGGRFFPLGYSTTPLITGSTTLPTSTASSNNRIVSATRWNAPNLNTGSEFSASGQLPRWILIDRQGVAPSQSWSTVLRDYTPGNDRAVVGRFAFNAYDVGGLLDANVAGFPIFSTPLTNAQIQQLKSTQAGAYLYDASGAIIPGFDQARQAAFVNTWKYTSEIASTFFLNFMSRTIPPSTTICPTFADSGFMRATVRNPGSASSNSNTIAYSRQDLIRLTLAANGYITTDALPYFTHFSRELNAPSWTPIRNASDMGGNAAPAFAYFTNKDDASAINRDVLNVRVQTEFIRADGTQAITGEPLIKNRFPLRRLDAIGSTGVNVAGFPVLVVGVLQSPSVSTIQRDFGLTWNAANNRWDYASGTIATLNQVASANREPNFFELLKAFILSGSIGVGSDNTGSGRTFVNAEPRFYEQPDSSDAQIIQIGANIIDQWDADKNPTFIVFDGNEFAGAENLPLLSKIGFQSRWTSTTAFTAFLVPCFWTPPQNATFVGTPNATTPTIRFVMTSGTVGAVVEGGGSLQATPVSGSATQPSVNLTTTANFGSPDAASSSTTVKAGMVTNGNSRLGIQFTFPVGAVTRTTATRAYPTIDNVTFEMQAQVGGPTGVWKTYQRWIGCNANVLSVTAAFQPPSGFDWTVSTILDPEFIVLDPRTMRFGVWETNGQATGDATDFNRGWNETMDRASGGFQVVTGMRPQGTHFTNAGAEMGENLGSVASYTDLDGVRRRGDYLSAGATSAIRPTNSTDRSPILSRQIRTVAELGTVYRDQPWKTLNFVDAVSADSGLIDAFTIFEPNSVFRSDITAGKTSLNTRQAPVLRALLNGIATNTSNSTPLITEAQRDTVVDALLSLTAAQPMINKSELIGRLAGDPAVTGLGNKESREAVIRALSDVGQTRTWNLMIDVIAQSGRYSATASALENFIVQGEKRYWLHVAIDRFTGEVIDQQLEAVYE